MRSLTGTRVASFVAVVIAGLLAAFFEPFPPLLWEVHSLGWTRLIEWFVVSVALLLLLSLMGLTDLEFEISRDGFKYRRTRVDNETIDRLRTEVKELEEDNKRLLRLTRKSLEEQSLRTREQGGPHPDDGEDDDG